MYTVSTANVKIAYELLVENSEVTKSFGRPRRRRESSIKQKSWSVYTEFMWLSTGTIEQ